MSAETMGGEGEGLESLLKRARPTPRKASDPGADAESSGGLAGLLGKAVPKAARRQETEPGQSASRMALIAENQSFKTREARSHKIIRLLIAISALGFTVAAGAVLYAQAGKVRALNTAFEIISYRENKALSANAIVLDEWISRVDAIIAKVRSVQGITEEERATRVKTLTAARLQAQTLKDQFLKQIRENERERGNGPSFSYKDPFLKREIKLAEDNGGMIDLDKLRAEVKEQARLDEAMRAMDEAMSSPVPMADQVRLEAERLRAAGKMSPQQQQQQQQGDDQTAMPAAASPDFGKLPGAAPAEKAAPLPGSPAYQAPIAGQQQ